MSAYTLVIPAYNAAAFIGDVGSAVATVMSKVAA